MFDVFYSNELKRQPTSNVKILIKQPYAGKENEIFLHPSQVDDVIDWLRDVKADQKRRAGIPDR